MRAMVFTRYGEPADVLELRELPDPPGPGAGEVQVRVLKRVIHPGDMSRMRGHFPGEIPPQGITPGFEGLGHIEAVGAGVDPDSGLIVGARVVFFDGPRAWAERVVVPAAHTFLAPDDLPDEIACQLLVNGVTAIIQLRAAEAAAPGRAGRESPLLMTAAGSAVARIMILLAMMRGLKIVATVRSPEGAAALAARFPDLSIVTTADPDWRAQVRSAVGERLLVAIDPIGGAMARELIDLLADGGTLIQYGDLDLDPVSVQSILLSVREITLQGTSIIRWFETTSAEQRRQDAADAFNVGRHAPAQFGVIGEYDFADAIAAIAAAETPGRTGAVLVTSTI